MRLRAFKASISPAMLKILENASIACKRTPPNRVESENKTAAPPCETKTLADPPKLGVSTAFTAVCTNYCNLETGNWVVKMRKRLRVSERTC